MTPRDRTVLSIVTALGVLAAIWFLALNPRRQDAKHLAEQVAAAQQRLDTARQTVTSAQRARASYDADYAAVARLGKAVPADDDVPSLLYQLEHAADHANVDFRAIKLSSGGGSTAVPAANSTPAQQVAQVGQAENATSTNTTSTSTTSSTGTTATTPADATQTATAGLPPGAQVGLGGFPTMPFDFSFTGSFFRLEGFLKALDRFTELHGNTIRVRGRLMTIDGISLAASAKGFPQMVAKIHATAFLLPSDQGLTNGATAAGPAASPAATTTTPSPAATAAITGGKP